MCKTDRKLTFLGTGTSQGAPLIGCTCEVCQSRDPRDRRLRCSALLETDGTRILIDCGPDFRQQALALPFSRIDGVVLTHNHYDHVGGMDDLRPFAKFGDTEVYADHHTIDSLRHTMPYCFEKVKYPGVPRINVHEVEAHRTFRIGSVDVMPVAVMHGHLPILGYRFGPLAYITDMKTMAEGEYGYLKGVDTLVINALRFTREHHSHQLVGDAIDVSRRIGARETYLIHTCHHVGLHAEAERRLPAHFHLAYDGQAISF